MQLRLAGPSAVVMSAILGWVISNVALINSASAQTESAPAVVKRTLDAYPGKTPTLDGKFAPGEWSDATRFDSTGWVSTFSPVKSKQDLFAVGYVKHDGKRLYFGFDVTDDVLYGIDTPRWLPDNNAKVHELTRDGWPWFGDEMEILINASNKWVADESVSANGSSWQMVCNLTKSRFGGVGVGGLLEGEPRSKEAAWKQYQAWVQAKAMECSVAKKPNGKGYFLEWAINFDPCLEVEPGKFYSPALGKRTVGLNIALGDLDQKERGQGNFGNFHHEDWFSGTPKGRTNLNQFGSLHLHPNPRK